MFSNQDQAQIAAQGISKAVIDEQIQHFTEGFPYLPLTRAATVGDGILRLADEARDQAVAEYESRANALRLLKFVPASGAATRMFKSLFGFLDARKSDQSVEEFFEKLTRFAFYEALWAVLIRDGLRLAETDEHTVVEYFLTDHGLGYGSLPKGLLLFHGYDEGARTPVEEHLVEGARYANSGGTVYLHFTVSPEHRAKFSELLNEKLPHYEGKFGVKFDVSFSEQQPSTDTIAVNPDNTPFREKDGSLLFRPAGHGALLANLNALDADVVFIKNIDNVVPDRLKDTTVEYKKALAGVLLTMQERIFEAQRMLDEDPTDENLLMETAQFLEIDLCVAPPEGFAGRSAAERAEYLKTKLNRPLRVCGMVPNVGEPGGGPFWATNADGSSSLQVVESAQVDPDHADQQAIFKNATHFNPVDLVVSLKNYRGEKFDLLQYRDPQTGFITQKSKDGKDLKAQELPGLWNGSMADWNTLFVEVPLITFNPVKTVNDLLRPEHQ
jgi:hypothetical protein